MFHSRPSKATQQSRQGRLSLPTRAFLEVQLGLIRWFPGRSHRAALALAPRSGLRDLSFGSEGLVPSEADSRSSAKELRYG
jgi:hypothetical protein